MSGETDPARQRRDLPGVTACSLCSGETLGDAEGPGAQLTRLRRLRTDGVARVTLSECLDECERGDVVVARPSRAARRSGRPVWFERLAGEAATEELAGWLRAGGPGAADLPSALEPLRIRHAPDPADGATAADGAIAADGAMAADDARAADGAAARDEVEGRPA